MHKLKVNAVDLAAQRYREAVSRDAPFLELVKLRLAHDAARAAAVTLVYAGPLP